MSAVRVRYPFVRCMAEVFVPDACTPEGGAIQMIDSWRPGTDGEDSVMLPTREVKVIDVWLADGMGWHLLTELGRANLPKPLTDRVVYRQSWIDPDGREFGKQTVRVCTDRKWRLMLKGWRGAIMLPDGEIIEPARGEP